MSKQWKSIVLLLALCACVAPISKGGPSSFPEPTIPAPEGGSPSAASSADGAPAPTSLPLRESAYTVRGAIWDDRSQALEGATVAVLNSAREVMGKAKTGAGGIYSLTGEFKLDSLIVQVTYPGYTSRERVITPTGGDLKVDFKEEYAPSNRPEIVSVEPVSLASPLSSIMVRFSESMEEKATEAAFALAADAAHVLSVGFALPAGLSSPDKDNAVYTSSQFERAWSDGGTVLTLTPKASSPIPTDASSSRRLSYRVSFSYAGGGAKGIMDLNGNVGRTAVMSPKDGPFRVGNGFQPYAVVSVPGDAESPKIEDMALIPKEGGGVGDQIKLTYSKPMRLLAQLGIIVGGADGVATRAPAGSTNVSAADAAKNYEISVEGGPWLNLGADLSASATFDVKDGQNRTIVISTDDDVFHSGQEVSVRLANPVKDPQGNSVSIGTSLVTAQAP